MNIQYDHQAFTIQEYGGISRYFYELTRQFQTTPQMSVSTSLLFSNNEYIHKSKLIQSSPFFRRISLQRKVEAMNLINELHSRSIYKQNNFDLFHPTYYDPYYVNLKSKKPIVITFHDIIHEKFMANDQVTLSNKRKVILKADRIIAVSVSSKCDLIEYYKVPEEKITVIPLASSISPPASLANGRSHEQYLLYVGGRNHYKNFILFVRAIAPVLLSHSGLLLCCVGGGRFNRTERELFHELKIQDRVKFQVGTDENLSKSYSNALAFFFPSLYEGFGIPLLEAMNCGCPIGASQTSSLPEVAGNAALYFDPYDKDSMRSVAEALVLQPPLRANLIRNGFLRAKNFSWQKTSGLTHDVYSELI
jgi:glycosyltransferase involved in cell wall biosynthesis